MLKTHNWDKCDMFLHFLDQNENFLYKLNKNLLRKPLTVHSLTGPNEKTFSGPEKTKLLQTPLKLSSLHDPGIDLPKVNTKIQNIKQYFISNKLYSCTPLRMPLRKS